jgi:hypothetical protein
VASGLLVRPMGSSVAKQPLQGLTAQPLARLAQRAGADGFSVLFCFYKAKIRPLKFIFKMDSREKNG